MALTLQPPLRLPVQALVESFEEIELRVLWEIRTVHPSIKEKEDSWKSWAGRTEGSEGAPLCSISWTAG